MKKLLLYVTLAVGAVCSSCQDWLDVIPNNERVTDEYWQTKEDVEHVLTSGYAYMRSTTPLLIKWGELRGASISVKSGSTELQLQNFKLTPSNKLCDWGTFYQVLNMVNQVIKYAPQVQQIDATYNEAAMKSHLTEAYFLRALSYFYLVRNFRDVPLVLEPYMDDSAPYKVGQSSEAEVIARIKTDIETALATGAAQEFFEDDEWAGASKGRATKWALHALMVDVCLWSGDYDGCVEFADYLLNATATRRPVFMKTSSQWYDIYYPGNSNESIFELNWSEAHSQIDTNMPSALFTEESLYQFTQAMCERLYEERLSVRGEGSTYVDENATGDDKLYRVWKYIGFAINDALQTRPTCDLSNGGEGKYAESNFIIYRMADVMLMKAEALACKGKEHYQAAIDIVNEIRERAELDPTPLTTDASEQELLQVILNERDMELAAEGKRWYDLVRFGRKYKQAFISLILENNDMNGVNSSWISSTLEDENSWFLPVSQSQIDINDLLKQNPYYEGL